MEAEEPGPSRDVSPQIDGHEAIPSEAVASPTVDTSADDKPVELCGAAHVGEAAPRTSVPATRPSSRLPSCKSLAAQKKRIDERLAEESKKLEDETRRLRLLTLEKTECQSALRLRSGKSSQSARVLALKQRMSVLDEEIGGLRSRIEASVGVVENLVAEEQRLDAVLQRAASLRAVTPHVTANAKTPQASARVGSNGAGASMGRPTTVQEVHVDDEKKSMLLNLRQRSPCSPVEGTPFSPSTCRDFTGRKSEASGVRTNASVSMRRVSAPPRRPVSPGQSLCMQRQPVPNLVGVGQHASASSQPGSGKRSSAAPNKRGPPPTKSAVPATSIYEVAPLADPVAQATDGDPVTSKTPSGRRAKEASARSPHVLQFQEKPSTVMCASGSLSFTMALPSPTSSRRAMRSDAGKSPAQLSHRSSHRSAQKNHVTVYDLAVDDEDLGCGVAPLLASGIIRGSAGTPKAARVVTLDGVQSPLTSPLRDESGAENLLVNGSLVATPVRASHAAARGELEDYRQQLESMLARVCALEQALDQPQGHCKEEAAQSLREALTLLGMSSSESSAEEFLRGESTRGVRDFLLAELARVDQVERGLTSLTRGGPMASLECILRRTPVAAADTQSSRVMGSPSESSPGRPSTLLSQRSSTPVGVRRTRQTCLPLTPAPPASSTACPEEPEALLLRVQRWKLTRDVADYRRELIQLQVKVERYEQEWLRDDNGVLTPDANRLASEPVLAELRLLIRDELNRMAQLVES